MKKRRGSLENYAMWGIIKNISVMRIEKMMLENTSIPLRVPCPLSFHVSGYLCVCVCVVALYKRSTVLHLEVHNSILLTIETML